MLIRSLGAILPSLLLLIKYSARLCFTYYIWATKDFPYYIKEMLKTLLSWYKKYDAELTVRRMIRQKLDFKTILRQKKRDISICDALHRNHIKPHASNKRNSIADILKHIKYNAYNNIQEKLNYIQTMNKNSELINLKSNISKTQINSESKRR